MIVKKIQQEWAARLARMSIRQRKALFDRAEAEAEQREFAAGRNSHACI